MLDIDLEFLNFLLNPTYEYLSNDIKLIENEYIKNKRIPTHTNVNYLFVTNTIELAHFINDITEKITEDIYIRFGNFFGLNLKNNIEDNPNNFIIDILKSKGLTKLTDDTLVIILKTDIKEYLTNIIDTSNNEKEVKLANDALIYLYELIIKYDNITNLTTKKLQELLIIFDKKTEIKKKIQKLIIKEYSFLLTEEGKNIINNNNDYDVEKLLENEEKFNYYLNIKLSKTDPLKQYVFDYGTILDNCNSNIDSILKEKMKKTEFKDYNKLSYDLIKYNEFYEQECEDYILTITKEELKENIHNIIDKNIDEIIKEANNLYLSKEKILQLIEDVVLTNILDNSFYNSYNIQIKTIILSPINCVSINDNNKLECKFYDILSHELGHACDFYQTSNVYEDILNYCLLYEIYNDYSSRKIINKVIWDNKLTKEGVIHISSDGAYSNHFFGLLDIFYEYNDIFREWIDNKDINCLKKIFGNKNFNKFINNIDTFDEKKFPKEEKYSKKLIKSYDNILKQTKRKTKFKNIIN